MGHTQCGGYVEGYEALGPLSAAAFSFPEESHRTKLYAVDDSCLAINHSRIPEGELERIAGILATNPARDIPFQVEINGVGKVIFVGIKSVRYLAPEESMERVSPANFDVI